jgi:adenosylcobinamide-phosphate synthase
MTPIYILSLALFIDLIIGEPPEVLHPVVWIGKVISALKNAAPKDLGKARAFGFFIVVLCLSLFIMLTCLLLFFSFALNYYLGILVSAYFLKSTFSIRCFSKTAIEIKNYLEADDLESARKKLPWLVGREPSNLSKSEVASATIESVAENFMDTILSPLFFFTLFAPLGLGIPAAVGYKVINTLDSVVGYKELAYGFWAAKADEAVNFIPARLSVLFLSIANPRSAGNTLGVCKKDRNKTESINSGYPMSAMAGLLGVKLTKPGQYVLGEGLREPEAKDISGAIKVLWVSTAIVFVLSGVLISVFEFGRFIYP